jgi:phosphate transport system protein
MFHTLLSFWKGKDFLTTVLKEFEEMLVVAEDMYKAVQQVLVEGTQDPEAVRDKIYQVDRSINGLEKNIRKRIVEHLTLQPTVDVPVCLVLMSVVKDAERLGDYAKNLFEVSELLKGPIDQKLFRELFGNADEQLIQLAEKTRNAFIQSDESVARELFVLERDIVFKCQSALHTLAESDLNANTAVSFTLISRYFKRIAAHLSNIGTSVILPVDKLDFFDEKTRHEKIKKEGRDEKK